MFHIALFTDDGSRDSRLWVFDQGNGRQWKSTPDAVGYQKYLYRVTLPHIDPNIIEDAFSVIESAVAPIIKICDIKSIPSGKEDYNWLINYIAALAMRTPTTRKAIAELTKEITTMILAKPEKFEQVKRNMETEYNDPRTLIYGGKHGGIFRNNEYVRHLMGTIDAIIQPLGARHWAVVFSPSSTGDFILSDNPVNLHWREKKGYRIWRSPGCGLKETEVTIPLSSRIMLMGHFEDIPSNLNICSKKDLASMNNFTVMHSDRFLYS